MPAIAFLSQFPPQPMHPQHKNNVAVSLRTAYGFVVTAKEPVLPFMFG